MTRRRPWLHSITPQGLIVTSAAALVTLGLYAAAIALYLRSDLDGAKDCVLQASAALTALTALQARLRPDPAAQVDPPATVTASPTD